MEVFVTFLLNLIYISATLALIALGLAMVFGLLGVMNMAHGEFVMLGAYSVYVVQLAGQHFLWAIPVAIVICVMVGWLMEWLVVRHLYSRPFDTLLATWGVAILIRKGVEVIFTRDYKSVNQVMPGTIDLLGVSYPAYRLLLVALIIVLFVALFTWYQKSKAGLKIRAMVQGPELAAAVGIDTARLSRLTFIIGVSTAGLAGVLLAPLVRVEPYIGLDYLMSSFFILIVGGLGTLEGLLIGSTVIGGTDAIVSTVFDKTAGYMSVLLISILFLWLRPDGIFYRR
ncbi:MAG: High-affinity branched-chain amino acid transport system permease protein LivH [Alphaproteobacteria bacterium MarineAlpha3_Bin7]|nr:MAG: High-affinity branched-chain amino acid transport system permease protein LivH [Alphaproteobacteria bacterium MarineAlpha3_Bin7]